MFRQAIITVTSISMGLCPVVWAEQALLALDVGTGEREVAHRACAPTGIGTGEQHLGFGLSLLGFKGEMSQLLWTREKTWLLLFRLFPRGLAAPLKPGTIGGRKMPLNLAIAALGIFLAPTNTAQPLMSHNWLLSAPNHFTEVRINF